MEDQKAKILNASEKLFMRYGLKSVSMDDVAKHLGISKKTIYNFLKDKKTLYFKYYNVILPKMKMSVKKYS